MDLVALKKQYGRDRRAQGEHPDPYAPEQEIATKIPVAKEGGGYIYELDDGPVVYNASLAQCRRLLDLVHRYGRYD